LKRGFVQFIIDPIQRVFDACMKDRSKLDPLLVSMDIRLNEEEQSLLGKDLLKVVMQKWLPASEALLEMITTHLPSPTVAQKYRIENLYTGPMDDETAESIRTCNPEGPLVVFVSKMLPNKDRSRFLAFGRVFSGTVYKGQKVFYNSN
jgi:elongation factor 2